MGYSALANNVVRRQLFFYFCRHLHPYFVPVGLKKEGTGKRPDRQTNKQTETD